MAAAGLPPLIAKLVFDFVLVKLLLLLSLVFYRNQNCPQTSAADSAPPPALGVPPSAPDAAAWNATASTDPTASNWLEILNSAVAAAGMSASVTLVTHWRRSKKFRVRLLLVSAMLAQVPLLASHGPPHTLRHSAGAQLPRQLSSSM